MHIKIQEFRIKLIIAILTICIFSQWGCEKATNSWSEINNTAQQTQKPVISGTITYSPAPQANNLRLADLNGQTVAGAEVYLENLPQIKTISGAQGEFLLENVPPGTHVIVANLKDTDNRIYKKRSAAVTVTDKPVEVGFFALLEARSVVKGYLRDVNNNPISNAAMSLWGETFFTSPDGFFTSPPLPAEISEARIVILQAPGFKPFSFSAIFSAAVSPALELTLVSPDNSKLPPVIQLSTAKSEVAPGEQVILNAQLSDADEPDLSSKPISWHASHGNLVVSNNFTTATWIAPDDNVTASITAAFTDATNLSARAGITLKVGSGGIGNLRPVLSNIRIASQTENIKITYDLVDAENDPVSIRILFSTDGGSTFSQTLNLSGATAQIIPGSDKSIIWKPGLDLTQLSSNTIIRMIATDRLGDGQPSQSPLFALDSQNLAPATGPVNISVVSANAANAISWDPVAGATGYKIYWATSAGVSKQTSPALTPATSPYNHAGLTNGTTYYYIITAINSWGESPGSITASGRPLPPVPAIPGNLAAIPGSTTITLNWNNVTAATSYNLYWSTQPDVSRISANKIAAVQSPFTHSGRTHGTTYYYVVTAENLGGESAESSVVHAYVDAAPPQILSLTPANQSFGNATDSIIRATFNEPVFAGSGQISIFRGDGVLHETFAIESANVSINDKQLTITPSTGLIDDTFYYIHMTAGTVKDSYNNMSASIDGNASWRFKTTFAYNETLQWNLATINASAAWVYSTGEGVTVAVIDTGVEPTHPELTGQIAAGGADYFNDGYFLQDGLGHGTHVAGIIAAKGNNSGVIGIAPRAKLYISKVFSRTGVGPSAATIVSAVQDAVNHGARIINMSIGTKTFNSSYEDVAAWARTQGALIIAAAGNDTSNELRYLAACPSAIAIGATDRNDALWPLSNFAPELAYSAPGDQILSTYPGAGYGEQSGTSMASPHIAAVAALVLAKNPGFTIEQLLAALTWGSVDLGTAGRDAYFGHGRIDALKAVEYSPTAGILKASVIAGTPAPLPRKSDFSAENFVAGELLIRLKPNQTLANVLSEGNLDKLGIKFKKSLPMPDSSLIAVPVGQEIELGKKLQNLPGVVYAELNAIISLN